MSSSRRNESHVHTNPVIGTNLLWHELQIVLIDAYKFSMPASIKVVADSAEFWSRAAPKEYRPMWKDIEKYARAQMGQK